MSLDPDGFPHTPDGAAWGSAVYVRLSRNVVSECRAPSFSGAPLYPCLYVFRDDFPNAPVVPGRVLRVYGNALNPVFSEPSNLAYNVDQYGPTPGRFAASTCGTFTIVRSYPAIFDSATDTVVALLILPSTPPAEALGGILGYVDISLAYTDFGAYLGHDNYGVSLGLPAGSDYYAPLHVNTANTNDRAAVWTNLFRVWITPGVDHPLIDQRPEVVTPNIVLTASSVPCDQTFVELSWVETNGNDTTYTLRRNGVILNAAVAGLTYIDTPLSLDTSYTYTVTGNTTAALSNSVMATTLTCPVPPGGTGSYSTNRRCIVGGASACARREIV